MAVFAYKAIDPDASAVRGTVTADTPRQAREQLRARGLTIQRIAEHSSRWRWEAVWPLRRRMQHRAEVTEFVRELSTLLAVGIPLLEALDTIARQHKGRFKASVLMLRDRVAAGHALAETMREQPMIYDDLCLNIVEVGEDAGTLETSLERLAAFRERSQQLRGRIGTALIYPVIVLSTGAAISVVLMTAVLPNLLDTLVQSGETLPLPTRIVQAGSYLLLHGWWLLVLLFLGGAAAGSAVLRSEKGRLAWHRLQLRIPLLGDLIRKQAVVRVALVLATLMRSGIVFVRAIRIAQRTTTNHVLRQALADCEQAVYAGQDIAVALEKTDAFPPAVVQIFAVGQQSGRLEEMLDRLAGDYDQQVAAAAQRFTAVLEPLLILLLATVVGFIAFATILPILQAGQVM